MKVAPERLTVKSSFRVIDDLISRTFVNCFKEINTHCNFGFLIVTIVLKINFLLFYTVPT